LISTTLFYPFMKPELLNEALLTNEHSLVSAEGCGITLRSLHRGDVRARDCQGRRPVYNGTSTQADEYEGNFGASQGAVIGSAKSFASEDGDAWAVATCSRC
jgi:hypothetical protein